VERRERRRGHLGEGAVGQSEPRREVDLSGAVVDAATDPVDDSRDADELAGVRRVDIALPNGEAGQVPAVVRRLRVTEPTARNLVATAGTAAPVATAAAGAVWTSGCRGSGRFSAARRSERSARCPRRADPGLPLQPALEEPAPEVERTASHPRSANDPRPTLEAPDPELEELDPELEVP